MGEKDGSHLENEGKQALGIHQSEEEPTGKSFDAPGFSAFFRRGERRCDRSCGGSCN